MMMAQTPIVVRCMQRSSLCDWVRSEHNAKALFITMLVVVSTIGGSWVTDRTNPPGVIRLILFLIDDSIPELKTRYPWLVKILWWPNRSLWARRLLLIPLILKCTWNMPHERSVPNHRRHLFRGGRTLARKPHVCVIDIQFVWLELITININW